MWQFAPEPLRYTRKRWGDPVSLDRVLNIDLFDVRYQAMPDIKWPVLELKSTRARSGMPDCIERPFADLVDQAGAAGWSGEEHAMCENVRH